ncbi:efflux RND transporter periplasmic adaptor subunit [Actimicrobium sp. CCI2.3]|uniref:efflux RND transporter periplasmic adaptor subunit n=1 Tax=Actimicrobium sp. CCI2.3 TaxID=3048616 RepID=UPI002AB3F349|nr:efflux RND transporter periplasmic adaptor subunit [Actimicrobium sp. CCI2.3]MDY7576435.1 efflux RND transporter periplasmic adaptor subunit [Actimicrobium sp. CCI2.3]MEB0021585.1 efflux RND transporter periplasmic adaptor subunit [Actimicrobium sp. CCI2.3]
MSLNRRHHHRCIIAAALALLVTFSLTAAPLLERKGEQISVPAGSSLRARLLVSPVGSASTARQLALPAIVEADPALTVNILPPLSGRLGTVSVRLGDVVRQGQLLALLQAPDMTQAAADLDKATDARVLTRRALERADAVNAAGGNAGKDTEQARSNDMQAQAEMQRASARLAALGSTDGHRALRITAPIAGAVTVVGTAAGAYINDTTASLMTIANLERVLVTAYVPENQIGAISRGQTADIRLPAFPGLALRGVISYVSAVVEPDTRRIKVRITLPNPDGKLKPNMFASVQVSSASSPRLVLPTSALLMNNDSVSVFVETASWTFVRRPVTLGSEDGETVQILSGVRAGERVVVRGGVLLND